MPDSRRRTLCLTTQEPSSTVPLGEKGRFRRATWRCTSRMRMAPFSLSNRYWKDLCVATTWWLGQTDAPLYVPLFHVAVVQFEDDGRYAKPPQIEAALDAIRTVRQSNLDGAVVVVLDHGWHQTADWKRTPSTLATDTDGDDQFHSFRLILESLALRES